MIPMPIFIPSGSSSGVEMIYPKWVTAIAYFGGLAAAIDAIGKIFPADPMRNEYTC